MQHEIAGGMPMLVVEPLEMVDVDDQATDDTLGRGRKPLQLDIEAAAVVTRV
ncbi:hypothetical protein [Stakelama saccharophila]|uniref:Uncharacterized protein n=1 Tax=Stakelama saccharophila TaxID=3075605 RepID=A0ABZ0B8R6_9SPHN|nr:hypothetical protein [Stakelama sp. W311]WNO53612.1 hypothetical protein RPR59_14430 [Stakelama sp. W311]